MFVPLANMTEDLTNECPICRTVARVKIHLGRKYHSAVFSYEFRDLAAINIIRQNCVQRLCNRPMRAETQLMLSAPLFAPTAQFSSPQFL
jgi:hypothetical protein